MTRASLSIVFDRPDRTYRVGDRVRGHVLVHGVGERTPGAPEMTRRWRTHGKGNTDEGERHHVQLVPEPPAADGTLVFRFDFRAPSRPLTYRGHFLNVDHYLEASLDVPWAFDPTAEEEFLVVPGSLPYWEDKSLRRPLALAPSSGVGAAPFIGGAALLFGLVSFTPLLMLIGGGVLAYGLRKPMARSRMGSVTVHLPSILLVAGQSFEVEITIRPRKRLFFKSLTMVLLGREVCTSGSGSDRKTHKHEIARRRRSFAGASSIPTGQTTTLRATVQVPEVHAYSFRAPNNRVLWDVTFHASLPSWPDWRETHELLFGPARSEAAIEPPVQAEVIAAPRVSGPPAESEPEMIAAPRVSGPPVDPEMVSPPTEPGMVSLPAEREVIDPPEELEVIIPPAELEVPTADEEPPEEEDEAIAAIAAEALTLFEARIAAAPPAEQEAVASTDLDQADGSDHPQPEEEATLEASRPDDGERDADAAVTREPGGESSLATSLRSIHEQDRRSPEKASLIEGLIGESFRFVLTVGRVERSFGSLEATYRGGRTIQGTIGETALPVTVRFPAARNDEVARLPRSSRLAVRGVVVEWQDLKDRPTLEADPEPMS